MAIITTAERNKVYTHVKHELGYPLREFELKLRSLITSKLGENLGNTNYNLNEFKKRRENDEKWHLETGSLIDYADFGEYSKILESNWDKFEDCFQDKTEILLPLNLLNAIARRPLAHFRKVNRSMIEISKQLIGPVLEKIKVNDLKI